MMCPICGSVNTNVLNSRYNNEKDIVKRRRVCSICGRRFTTSEIKDEIKLSVRKENGHVEAFQQKKIINCLSQALYKNIESQEVKNVLAEVLRAIFKTNKKVLDTSNIIEIIADELLKVNKVAAYKYKVMYKKVTSIKALEIIVDQVDNKL